MKRETVVCQLESCGRRFEREVGFGAGRPRVYCSEECGAEAVRISNARSARRRRARKAAEREYRARLNGKRESYPSRQRRKARARLRPFIEVLDQYPEGSPSWQGVLRQVAERCHGEFPTIFRVMPETLEEIFDVLWPEQDGGAVAELQAERRLIRENLALVPADSPNGQAFAQRLREHVERYGPLEGDEG